VDTGLSDPCHYYSGDEILRSTQSIQTNWIAGLAYHDPPLAAVGRLVGCAAGVAPARCSMPAPTSLRGFTPVLPTPSCSRPTWSLRLLSSDEANCCKEALPPPPRIYAKISLKQTVLHKPPPPDLIPYEPGVLRIRNAAAREQCRR
jgi:hypothetical protein